MIFHLNYPISCDLLVVKGIRNKQNASEWLLSKYLHFRNSHWRCSFKFRKFHRKTPVLEYLFDKVPGLNTFFTEHLQWLLLKFC